MRVTAVVVNLDGAAYLPACLDALAAQDHPDLDVLVIDNASTDGSRALLSERDVRVRWNATNRGYAGAANDALRETDAPALLLLNPDVVVEPDHVRRLVAVLEAGPSVGSVQGKLLRPGRSVLDSAGHAATRARLFRNRGEEEPDDGRFDEPAEVFGVSGACALYRRAMLEDVGGFDERLVAYFEDVDVDWRMRLRGWSARYEPAAVAVHERGGIGRRRTRRVEALNFRNRLLVVAKCDDPRRLLAALPLVVATTAAKAAALLVTDPLALLHALGGLLRALPGVLAERRRITAQAQVSRAAVVDAWFEPFDVAAWLRTARRLRG